MSKITLNPVGSLTDTTTAANTININSVTVQNAIDNTLSRDGSQPNVMEASLDMNSNRILNLPAPVGSLDPVRLVDLSTLATGGTINTLPTGGTASQVLTKNTSTNYDVSWQTPAGSAGSNPVFGGRLTLSSGNPVMSSDVTSQTLYYAPYNGKTLPTYTGGVWTTRNFTSSSSDQVGLSLNLAGSANWAADTTHDVFAVMDSGTLKLGTRLWDAGMFTTETLLTPNVTITTGTTPTAWTSATNAFNGTTSQPFVNCATVSPGNAGEGQFLGQDWGVGVSNVISKVVIYQPNDHAINGPGPTPAETFTVYGSNDNSAWHLITIWRGNDIAAGNTSFTIPISITETTPYRYHRVGFDSDGVNALRVAQVQFYKRNAPANGRRLTHNDGVLVNDASMTIRTGAATTITTAQFEGIYLGTIHIDTSTNGSLTATTSYGLSRTYGVWNYYNKVPLKLQAGSLATVKSYTPDNTQRWNVCESTLGIGSTFNAQIVIGVAEEPVRVDLCRDIFLNCISAAASYETGIGVDNFINFSGRESSCNIDTVGQAIGFQPCAMLIVPPNAGTRIFYGLERQGNNATGIITSSTGPRHALLSVEWRG